MSLNNIRPNGINMAKRLFAIYVPPNKAMDPSGVKLSVCGNNLDIAARSSRKLTTRTPLLFSSNLFMCMLFLEAKDTFYLVVTSSKSLVSILP